MEEPAGLLAERCTVINYDRRGRGTKRERSDHNEVHSLIRDLYGAARPTAVIRYGTCALLKTRLSVGSLLVLHET
jgi:hypothetical protein